MGMVVMGPESIFNFWRIPCGTKVHPADVEVFKRLDPKRHGLQLQCLPASFAGPLRKAPLVLLFLSPGFKEKERDEADAKTRAGREFYHRQWQGNEPLRVDSK